MVLPRCVVVNDAAEAVILVVYPFLKAAIAKIVVVTIHALPAQSGDVILSALVTGNSWMLGT